ncbi:MAG: chemotaxis protein CheC [Pirellulales bacterium]
MGLNENELDALVEIINIGSGRAAHSLSEMTGSRIVLSVPNIRVCSLSNFHDVAKNLRQEFSTTVQQTFQGNVSGRALLAFADTKAFELARIVGGISATDSELDEELQGILEEIGNIVLNAILRSLANLVDCPLSCSLPQLSTNNSFSKIILGKDEQAHPSNSMVLIADTSIQVADRDISGSLLLLFETGDLEVMLSALMETPAG